jgi:hypothetical protein
MKRPVVLLACAVALLAASCGGKTPASSPERTAASAPSTRALPELTDIRQLQAAFAAHPGVPRLVILLSPT